MGHACQRSPYSVTSLTKNFLPIASSISPKQRQICAIICVFTNTARVVKLVDSGDSKSPAARRAGSSPAPGTISGNPASMRVPSESRPTLSGWLFFVCSWRHHSLVGQLCCTSDLNPPNIKQPNCY